MADSTDLLPEPWGPICVLFDEAVRWIAYRNFAGKSLGPQPLYTLRGEPEDSDAHVGRHDLGFDLLLSYAVKGKIRIYADGLRSQQEGPINIAEDQFVGGGYILLRPDFISRADYEYDVTSGPALYVDGESQKESERYIGLAVNYADLANHFWGAEGDNEKRIFSAVPVFVQEATSSSPSRPLRPLTRRGRPPKHKWSDFTAEAADYCLRNGPIRKQSLLLEHMRDWCAKHWQSAVEESDIAAYTAPIFRKFASYWQEAQQRQGEENSAS